MDANFKVKMTRESRLWLFSVRLLTGQGKKKDAFWFWHISGKMTEKKKKNQMLFSVGTSMVKYRRPARVLF